MTDKPYIRVMIADDHPVVVNGLRGMMGTAGGLRWSDRPATARKTVRLASELSPDVVVIDVLMPTKGGL